MHPLADRLVTKMNGLGNEIVVLDLRGSETGIDGAAARAIGHGPGLAYDQLMVVEDPRSAGTDAFMTIFNIDGSQAGACGNGTRCVAFLLTRDTSRRELILETAAARLKCLRVGDRIISVEMGRPRLLWHEIPLREACSDTRSVDLAAPPLDAPDFARASVVNMGNPHAIFFVPDLAAHDLSRIGPLLESDRVFPERANISLARIFSPQHIGLKVWERGAGQTRACGSAACATVVAAARSELAARRAKVSLPGGDLDIDWREADDMVVMTGPVELEFEARLDPALFEDIAA
jgi:diaminopimelate epimerase